jgi:hypothetical protein
MEDVETTAFRERLRMSMAPEIGSILVRVVLDGSSQVSHLCKESSLVSGGWRADVNLAQRISAYKAVAGGPACLADRRLDFNRRAAKLAEIKRRRLDCVDSTRSIEKSGVGLTGPESGSFEVENSDCVSQGADWIELTGFGLRHTVVFAKPEVSDPPDLSARNTRRKCFKNRKFSERMSCIKADGWELLE